MAIAEGNRVTHNDKNGTVIKVMSDGRAGVKWDDGTETIEWSGDLTKTSNPTLAPIVELTGDDWGAIIIAPAPHRRKPEQEKP